MPWAADCRCALACDIRIAEDQVALPEAKDALRKHNDLLSLAGEVDKTPDAFVASSSARLAHAVGIVEEVVGQNEAVPRALAMAKTGGRTGWS